MALQTGKIQGWKRPQRQQRRQRRLPGSVLKQLSKLPVRCERAGINCKLAMILERCTWVYLEEVE